MVGIEGKASSSGPLVTLEGGDGRGSAGGPVLGGRDLVVEVVGGGVLVEGVRIVDGAVGILLRAGDDEGLEPRPLSDADCDAVLSSDVLLCGVIAGIGLSCFCFIFGSDSGSALVRVRVRSLEGCSA